MEEAKKKVYKDQDWRDVYEYMKKLMGYGKDIKLDTKKVLRLKGLSKGKFMANKSSENKANYPFKIILITMQINTVKINEYVKRTSFTDEDHKFNGIMGFVERGINDVMVRMLKVEKNNIKTDDIDLSRQTTASAEYKPKEKKVSKVSDKLW